MKKMVSLLAVLCAALVVNAADNASIGVEAGYNNHYIVNGVSLAEGTPFIVVNAIKSL